MSWIWLLLAIFGEVLGTLGLRASDGFRKRIWLLPVALSYVVAFGFLRMALADGFPVGVAYGLWVAIGIVAIALAARVIWKDPITLRMSLGMVLIILGVLLVELG
ncbi:multidrug efflux SMR transporter [Gordonia caeni]|uniref:SMR family transporter n=1 Tax=Gordonia caeni TaxID=1007097 RepID=A0ABP7NZD3_9ACTN